MSQIDNGIKQPLRFYDSVDKQNWRRSWVKSGLRDRMTLLCPKNAIVPFQIRRRKSPNPLTIFDLYMFDYAIDDFTFAADMFALIPAPTTTHLKIIQMQVADNIIWNPQASLSIDLDCGYYYVHISDGTDNWYSEVFMVDDFTVSNTELLHAIEDHTIVGVNAIIPSLGNNIVLSSKIF